MSRLRATAHWQIAVPLWENLTPMDFLVAGLGHGLFDLHTGIVHQDIEAGHAGSKRLDRRRVGYI